MGQHVGNMFVNREASPIEAAETVHTTLLDQTLAPGATSGELGFLNCDDVCMCTCNFTRSPDDGHFYYCRHVYFHYYGIFVNTLD